MITIIILCSTDSGDVDARSTPLPESCQTSLWSLQITITLTDLFCNPALKNCWHGLTGIEPITLDLSSQSGANDLSATANQKVIPGSTYFN